MAFLQNTTAGNENSVVHTIFHFSPFGKEHLGSYGKRKPDVKDTPSGLLEGVEGTSYNGRDSGYPFSHAPRELWGWLSASPPTPQGAGNSINQPLPNYQLTN